MYTTTEDQVGTAIDAVIDSATVLAVARAKEMALEDERPLIKAEAVQRLLDSGVATSATAAEKVVEKDDLYMAHRQAQRRIVQEVQIAWGQYEAAKLRALAIATSRPRLVLL